MLDTVATRPGPPAAGRSIRGRGDEGLSKRSGVLEFAVLGLLRESPMHGYELRKRLNTSLGVFRAFCYGSLYPCLKTLVAQGWLVEEPAPDGDRRRAARPAAGRRSSTG